MNTLLILAFVGSFFNTQPKLPERPASPLFTSITNYWVTGQQSNVLALANARLATNQNDIVGLVLKASWDFSNSDRATLRTTHSRMLEAGSSIKTPAFSRAYKISMLGLPEIFKSLTESSSTNSAAHASRANQMKMTLGPMAYFLELYALDQDGLLQ